MKKPIKRRTKILQYLKKQHRASVIGICKFIISNNDASIFDAIENIAIDKYARNTKHKHTFVEDKGPKIYLIGKKYSIFICECGKIK